jgi:thiol-disulfide isomerase/thioredoxin
MYIVVNSPNDLNKLNTQKNKEPWFVWYYADWCGHCQMMKEEWEKLVQSNPNVNLAKVSDSYVKPTDNIVGYPTLKLYNSNSKIAYGKKTKILDYQGNRDVDSFKEFLQKHTKPKKLRKKKTKRKRNKDRTRTRRLFKKL